MVAAARARVKALSLTKRVQVSRLDMTDLSSVRTASFDVVTVCLGLHLIPNELSATLREIARVLKPGGHCVATVWDDAPLVAACLRTMEDMTGDRSGRWAMPADKIAYGGGRMDPLFAAAGLHPAAGHNMTRPMPFNLGKIVGKLRWWKDGPLSVLPRLGACPDEELDELKDAFRSRFRREGLVTSSGELEYTQNYRIMDVQK